MISHKMKNNNPNNPALKSWIEIPKDSDFPIQNIPFGVFKLPGKDAHCGSRIGDMLLI